MSKCSADCVLSPDPPHLSPITLWPTASPEHEEKTVVLPTAPSSVRGGLNVDLDRIPVNGPFKVFIANVSYDANESMVANMFQGLEVSTHQSALVLPISPHWCWEAAYWQGRNCVV